MCLAVGQRQVGGGLALRRRPSTGRSDIQARCAFGGFRPARHSRTSSITTARPFFPSQPASETRSRCVGQHQRRFQVADALTHLLFLLSRASNPLSALRPALPALVLRLCPVASALTAPISISVKMDQDDDIMAGTFADDPATSTSAAPTAGPGSPTSASTAASHELAASTSVSAGPPSAAVAAVSTDNSGAPIGSGSDGLSRQDSGGPAQPPKQTEAQKREERCGFTCPPQFNATQS